MLQKKAYRDDKLFFKLKYSEYFTKYRFHVSTTKYLIVNFSLRKYNNLFF